MDGGGVQWGGVQWNGIAGWSAVHAPATAVPLRESLWLPRTWRTPHLPPLRNATSTNGQQS